MVNELKNSITTISIMSKADFDGAVYLDYVKKVGLSAVQLFAYNHLVILNF